MRKRLATVLSVGLVATALATMGMGALDAEPALAVSPAAPSAGCGTSTVGAGIEQIDFVFSGEDRFYVRRTPPAHGGTTPVPIVFDFHGLSEGSAIHQVHSQFGPHGDANGYVTIFPQARGTGLNVSWSTGIGSVDVAMFGEMLDQLEADLCIDTNRVFVTGLSQGGFMSSSIACVYADRVAAIAPVAGLRNPSGCDPSRPIPVLNFHGTDDTIVSYNPIPGFTAAWAERNGCEATDPSVTFVGEDDVASVDHIVHDCPHEGAVELYRITGGGHTWPGSLFSQQIEAVVGYTTFVIDATDLIWQFFDQHSLPVTTATIEGKVLDAGNQPLAGAQVWAYTDFDLWVGSGFAQTADDGTYSLDVPPGEYRILFRTPLGGRWVSEWWLHSATRGGAPHAAVGPGETLTGIDGKLSPGGWVEGQVTDTAGADIGGALVWVYSDTDVWVGTRATTTDADGTYQLRGVPEGFYRVMFRAPSGSGLDHQWWTGLTLPQRWSSPLIHVPWNQAVAGVDAELSATAVL